MEKLLLTVEEGRALAGLGRTPFYKLLKSGAIRSVTIGRSRRIPRAAIEEFVQKLESEQVGY